MYKRWGGRDLSDIHSQKLMPGMGGENRTPLHSNVIRNKKTIHMGVFVGYRRNLREHRPHTAIVRIEGVNNRTDTPFYLGKRVAYIYRATKIKQGSKFRVIWGRIGTPHGNTGAFRAKFRRNLPPQAMGAALRVMLYPSRV